MTTPRVPAYRSISDSIRDDILARRLVPGDQLPVETELADRFGVSRSTVREALRELTSQNLVNTTRGATGGTFVVVPTTQHLAQSLAVGIEMLAGSADLSVAELLEARELLEMPAAELAAARGRTEEVDAIRTYVETHRADAAVGRELAANWSFHTLVMRAAHNPLLELMAEPIYYVLRTRFAESRAAGPFRQKVEDHHRAIATAIFDRDGQRASEEMRLHLEYLRPFYLDVDTRLGRK